MADAPKSVHVGEYDPAWPEQFRVLARRAEGALGDVALAVEHVGSTSVPGLAAKPVVDLAVVVRREDVPRAIERLATLGYVHEGDKGIPGREAFRTPPGEAKHHLYVCIPESRGLRDHLVFRDYLRAHPDVAREYADLKRRLAAEHRYAPEAYQLGKGPFIEAVMRRAGQGASAAPA
jgi:GrpB-like predicted nucleotidyltransferase (UPF0157 family)